MPRSPTPSGSRGKRLIWLLDLSVGVKRVRIAEEPIDAPGVDGVDTPYSGGLIAPNYLEGIDLFSPGPSERSVSVSFSLESPDFAAVAAQLDAGRGVLRLWVEGTEEYAVWLDGDVRRVERGGPAELIDVDISEDLYLDSGLIPSSSAQVSVLTWTTYSSMAEGVWYPVVYGSPGGVFGDSVAAPATPALLVDTVGDGGVTCDSRALVSLGRVAADTVLLTDTTTGAQDECGIVHDQDAAGNVVALALLDSAGNIMSHAAYDADTAKLWAGWWNSTNGNEPGIADGTGRGLHGLGQILCHALRSSSRRIDWGRMKAAASVLDAFSVDGVLSVSAPVSPWAWATEALLPLAPVGVVIGVDGAYVVPWRFDALPHDAEANFVAACVDPDSGEWGDGDAERVSRQRISDLSEIKNEVTLKYQSVLSEDRFQSKLVATGDPLKLGGNLNLLCRQSRSRYLSRGVEVTRAHEGSSGMVWDPATASAVVAWWVQRYALPSHSAAYWVRDGAAHLRPGSVVTLTDAELGLSGQVALVESMEWVGAGGVVLGLWWRG